MSARPDRSLKQRMPEIDAPLPEEFYARETVEVARDLVGRTLRYESPEGLLSGIIVETEAYGPDDAANHAFRGQTARNAAMFGPPGRAYVYRIYGMHWCLNAVTRGEGYGEAVLLRAVEPVSGIDVMQRNRGGLGLPLLCKGPGRLCAAFGITGALNGADLSTGPLTIVGEAAPVSEIAASTRVGISKAADLPWRFYLAGNPFVSRR
jgi:DNA-3-methyladenine glycosylase